MSPGRDEIGTWVNDGNEAIVDGHCEGEDLMASPSVDALVNPKVGIVGRY